jgi:hypothetical protein
MLKYHLKIVDLRDALCKLDLNAIIIDEGGDLTMEGRKGGG